jgi:hypothetical protein
MSRSLSCPSTENATGTDVRNAKPEKYDTLRNVLRYATGVSGRVP